MSKGLQGHPLNVKSLVMKTRPVSKHSAKKIGSKKRISEDSNIREN